MPNVNKSERKQALVLNPVSFSERVTWKLPETLKLDEMPDADKLDARQSFIDTVPPSA